jgi:two-component system, cell cycle response regulator
MTTLAPKIIVADDDQALSRTLSWILKENGYDVLTVPGGEHLFDHLQSEPFDLLLLDIMMPKVDGLQLLQKVKSDPRYKDLPVLMISSMPPEEATVRSLGLGAADFIPKPFRVRELLARVKAHLRVGRELNQARAEARSRSEMIDIMQEVTTSLKPEEIYQILVRRVAHALNISRCSIIMAGPEDVTGTVVAAFENPELHNLSVDLAKYPEVRRALVTGEVVLVRDATTDPLYDQVRGNWSATGEPVQTRSAIALRFLLRGQPAGVFFLRTTNEDAPLNDQDIEFAEQIITAAVSALEKAYDLESAVMGQEQMRHLAETDPLTNCFNRRALMEKLEQEMDRAARYATMLTGMMIDIDNFKQINDTHGHLVGDRVLKQLANLLKREQRSVDIVARYGGEEFVVLLPETTSAESRNFAERILRRVAGYDFGESGKPVRVTISIGIASYPGERVTDGESLLRLADNHLYRAKSDGRNRFRD